MGPERRGVLENTKQMHAPRLDNVLSADEMLTVHELAERLRLPSSWVYSHADTLGVYRLGKYLRFSWNRVLEQLDNQRDARVGSQPNDLRQRQ